MQQHTLATIFIDTSGLISLVFGFIYLFTPTFLNYHKKAIQKDWTELSSEIQIIILALMRVVAGGAFAVGITIIILQYYFTQTNLKWIPLIILVNGLIISSCSFFAMSIVRRFTQGRPPIAIIVLSVILIVTGYLLDIRK